MIKLKDPPNRISDYWNVPPPPPVEAAGGDDDDDDDDNPYGCFVLAACWSLIACIFTLCFLAAGRALWFALKSLTGQI